jgi:alpha-L-fucosidase 2
VSGLRARGGFEVEMAWDAGTLREARIRSLRGGPCTIRYGEKTLRLETRPGEKYRLNGELEPL